MARAAAAIGFYFLISGVPRAAEPPASAPSTQTRSAPAAPATRTASQPALDAALAIDLGEHVRLEFVLVPSGAFLMGSTEASDDERPVHPLRIARPFYLGKYEVTNAQYRRFKLEHDSGEFRGHGLNGNDQPAVQISWEDARAYCEWLTDRAGRTFRLPSEQEWEYACRAGGASAYSWGSDPEAAARFCNACDDKTRTTFRFSWAAFPKDDGFRVTAPVGQFKPNAFGLFDMHGNVWEWCADVYLPRYGGAESAPASQPEKTDPLEAHIHRGGSWVLGPAFCRCAARGRGRSLFRSSSVGFRVAADAR